MKGFIVGTVIACFMLAGCTSRQSVKSSPQYHFVQKQKEQLRRDNYRLKMQMQQEKAEAQENNERLRKQLDAARSQSNNDQVVVSPLAPPAAAPAETPSAPTSAPAYSPATSQAAGDQSDSSFKMLEDLPPNIRPDQCYAKITVPATYDVKKERVLVEPAYTDVSTVPAKYKTVTKRVMVHEAYDKLVAVPATYKEVRGKVKVKDETSKLISIPAKYKTVTETVLVQPKHKAWLPGHGNVEKYDESTGKIVHLATVPAKYKKVKTKKQVAPARTETKTIPAEYKEMTRKLVDVAAHTKTITVPAVYRNIQVVEQVAAPTEVKKQVPAVYKNVTTRKKLKDSRLAWREVVCDSKVTENMVSQLQKALNANGYSAGTADGVMGSRTKTALRQYQEEKGIAMGRLTFETLNKLGVRH